MLPLHPAYFLLRWFVIILILADTAFWLIICPVDAAPLVNLRITPFARRPGLPRLTEADFVRFNESLEGHVLFKYEGKATEQVALGHVLYRVSYGYMDTLFRNYDVQNTRILTAFSKLGLNKESDWEVHKNTIKDIDERWQHQFTGLKEEYQNYRRLLVESSKREEGEKKNHYLDPVTAANGHVSSEDDHWMGFHDDSDGASHVGHRVKRFVVSATGGIIGFIVTLLSILNFTELGKIKAQASQENSRTSNAHQFIVTKLQDLTEENAETREFTLRLEAAMQKVIQGQKDIQARNQYEFYKQTTYQVIQNEVRKMGSAIDALHQHQLSPLLIPSQTLAASLTALKAKAAKEGLAVPDDSTTFGYQLPVQFTKEDDLTLIIYLHVPLINPSNQFDLYRHIPAPIAIPGSIHNVEIQAEADYIAINRDRTGFVFLDHQDLTSCFQLGAVRVCGLLSYTLREAEKHCLSALFLKRQAAATSVCPIAVIPSSFKVVQISPTEFYVFHPREETVTIECLNKSLNRDVVFRGARLVDLKAGCSAHSPGYMLHATADIFLDGEVATTTAQWKLGQLVANISLDALEVMLPTPPSHPIAVQDLQKEFDEATKPDFDFPWPLTSLISVSTTWITVSIIIFLVYIFRGPLRRLLDCAGRTLSRQGSLISLSAWNHRREPPPEYPGLPDEINEASPSRRASFVAQLHTIAAQIVAGLQTGGRRVAEQVSRAGSRMTSRAASRNDVAREIDEAEGAIFLPPPSPPKRVRINEENR